MSYVFFFFFFADLRTFGIRTLAIFVRDLLAAVPLCTDGAGVPLSCCIDVADVSLTVSVSPQRRISGWRRLSAVQMALVCR